VRFLSAAQSHRKSNQGAYLQQYIEGEAASAVFVAAGGRANLLGATRQLLGRDFALERAFLYAGSLGPLELRAEELSRLRRLGELLAARFGLAGLFNIDFVRANDTLWVIEVNPRYSASIEVLERVMGVESIRLHVVACQRGEINPCHIQTPQGFAGKAIVYARSNAIVTLSLEELIKKWNRPGQPAGIADLPRVGDKIEASQPVVTVFAEADTAKIVEAELRRRVAEVQRALGT
jgi:predicted ATP-grasp superfamily ATP-dependent carboligase